MIDRRSLPWIAGLALLMLATTAAAVVLLWISSELSVRVNDFYSGLTGADQLPERTYEYWNTISSTAYVLSTVASPLLVGGLTAAFALLAVLARRYDMKRRVPADGQADADAVTVAS